MWVCRLARLFVTSPIQLEATITQVVAEITKKSPSQIAPSANFRSDLGMTSLEHLELLLILESKFNVDVESQTEADSLSVMITERHLFRLFINDEIQVPTLLHSLQACLDTCEDPSTLFSSFMLLVLVLEQGLDPAKLVMQLALKMLRSGKVSTERRKFLCVMLLRYTSKRYLSFLRFDDQMSILLQQLFETSRKLSTGEERIAARIAKETEELARVLAASPYALFIRPALSPSKSQPRTSRLSPAPSSLTPRTTIAETPSPAKGLSLLGKVRRAVEEASRELKGSVGKKVREVLRKQVEEAVKFCEKVDAQGEGVIESHLSALLSSLDQLLHLAHRTPSPDPSTIEALFRSYRPSTDIKAV